MNQGLLIRWKGETVEWLIHDAGQPIQEGHGSIESLTEALAFAVPLFYAMSAVGFAATSVVTERWERAKNN